MLWNQLGPDMLSHICGLCTKPQLEIQFCDLNLTAEFHPNCFYGNPESKPKPKSKPNNIIYPNLNGLCTRGNKAK